MGAHVSRYLGALLVALAFAASPPSRGQVPDDPATPVPDPGIVQPVNPDPLGEDAQDLAEYRGIDQPTARRYLQLQLRLGPMGGFLRGELPTFGGMYLTYEPTFHAVVLTTTGDRSEVQAALEGTEHEDLMDHVVVKEAPYTEGMLRRGLSQIGEIAPEGIEAQADIETGIITVWLPTEEDVRLLHSRLEHTDLPVPLEWVRLLVYPDGA